MTLGRHARYDYMGIKALAWASGRHSRMTPWEYLDGWRESALAGTWKAVRRWTFRNSDMVAG